MSFILGVQLYIMYVGTFSSILGTWIFCWTYEVRDNFGAGVVFVFDHSKESYFLLNLCWAYFRQESDHAGA